MSNKRLLIKLSPGNNHLINNLGSIDEKIENNELLSQKYVTPLAPSVDTVSTIS